MLFISVNEVVGVTDSERIQNAIRKAKETKCNKVVIPGNNMHAGRRLWEITDTILLPDDIEIFLDGAHLRLADDTFIHMFATENFYSEDHREQHSITIHGCNNAKLDGGNYNGLSESNSGLDGRPPIYYNTMLLFYHATGVSVHDLTICNQRWWGMTNLYVSHSEFKNITFRADLSRITADGVHYPDEFPQTYQEVYIKNADGIDLRVGCHDITIDQISGFTEDDTIALTALWGKLERLFQIKDKPSDICRINIKNIYSDCYVTSNVRLLCEDGNKIHHITIENITDTRTDNRYQSSATVRIGDVAYGSSGSEFGDASDILIRNVYSRGEYAVSLCKGLRNLVIENVYAEQNTCPFGVHSLAQMEGVTIKGLKTI